MKKLLNEICDFYPLSSVSSILEANTPKKLEIALLGEFSSGKSTLMNAMLGRKILPSNVTPTSKCIVSIETAPEADKIKPFKYVSGSLEEISIAHFQELATTSSAQKLHIIVPTKNFFFNEYLLHDTPGLASLDEVDADITFGLLTQLDGIIICQNINQGALTKSLIEFLKNPILKQLAKYTLVVLTHADTKPAANVTNIVQKSLKQLQDFVDPNIKKESVLAIDSKSAIINDILLRPIESAFKAVFHEQKAEMIARRQRISLDNAAKDALEQLRHLRNTSTQDCSDINKSVLDLQHKLEEFESQKQHKLKILTNLKKSLDKELTNTALYYSLPLSKAAEEGKEAIDELIMELLNNMQQVAIKNVNLYFDDFQISDFDYYITNSLKERLESIINIKNFTVMVSTGLLTAVILPGSSIFLQTGEAGIGIASKVGQVLTRTAASSAKLIFLHKTLDLINEMNVLEHAGRYFSKRLIKCKAEPELRKISEHASSTITNSIELMLEAQFFPQIELQMKDYKNQIDLLLDQKENRNSEFAAWTQRLDNYIVKLSQHLATLTQ